MYARSIAARSIAPHLTLGVAAFVLALALLFVPAPARAATLTSAQVNGVIGLLSAFGVDAATIANVRAILGTGTSGAPATTQNPAATETPVTTGVHPTVPTMTQGPNTPAPATRDSEECKGLSDSQRSEMQGWVSLYEQSEAAYNALWKAIARAGSAPQNYISPNVSPTITQGPTIPDSLDGKTILRKDLYFAHDEAAKARQFCRDSGCVGYTLPSTHSGAQGALNSYNAAMNALPLFAGPSGMRLIGSPYTYTPRPMEYNDYRKVKEELAAGTSGCKPGSSESVRTPGSSDTTTTGTNTTTASVSADKPSTAEFAAAAKTDALTASNVLYGVIGSNTDVRDWKVIMSSQNPLATARALTSAMYNSGSKAYLASGATRPQDRKDTTVLASSGNFAFYKEIVPGVGVNYVLALVDANGYQLTSAANPDVLKKHILNFGFNKSDLSTMQTQLESKGINLQLISSWPRNFGISLAPFDAGSLMAAAAGIPMEAMINSINLAADQIIEINWSLASVASAYAALFGF